MSDIISIKSELTYEEIEAKRLKKKMYNHSPAEKLGRYMYETKRKTERFIKKASETFKTFHEAGKIEFIHIY